jgi:hypothetical protein
MSVLAKTSPVVGHPIWHFAIVAGAAMLVLAGIKGLEWWGHSGRRLTKPHPAAALLAGLGLACSAIHIAVCPEHFREWIAYGIFFTTASAAQAGWSVSILIRPSRRLLLTGAIGNAAVISLYFFSRIIGVPFGPGAFKPETFDALSVAATACEATVVAGALYLTSHKPRITRPQRPSLVRQGIVRPHAGIA